MDDLYQKVIALRFIANNYIILRNVGASVENKREQFLKQYEELKFLPLELAKNLDSEKRTEFSESLKLIHEVYKEITAENKEVKTIEKEDDEEAKYKGIFGPWDEMRDGITGNEENSSSTIEKHH